MCEAVGKLGGTNDSRVSTAGDAGEGSSSSTPSRLLFHFAPPPGHVFFCSGFQFLQVTRTFVERGAGKKGDGSPKKGKKKLLTGVMDVKCV